MFSSYNCAFFLVNWCQYWFEYFPLPPMNILGMIENVLLEHDPRLLDHLMKHDVTSTIYAWSLLKVAFSETLTTQEWKIFWDHVFINEPAFLLMAVVTFSIVNRSVLFSLNNTSDFFRFYHSQSIPDMKLFITKTYHLLNTTSDRNHPRKYLKAFTQLQPGKYPIFSDYPKTMIDFKEKALNKVDGEKEDLELMKRSLYLQESEVQKYLQNLAKQAEQNKRLKELEIVYHDKIADEKQRILEEKRKLIEMQKQLHEEELRKLEVSRDKLLEKNVREKCAVLERLIKTVDSNKLTEELEMEKAKSNFLQKRKELLELKSDIEQFLQPQDVPRYTSHNSIIEQQIDLTQEIKKVTNKKFENKLKRKYIVFQVITNEKSQPNLQRVTVITGLAAIEDLMETVELELAKEVSAKFEKHRKHEAKQRVGFLFITITKNVCNIVVLIDKRFTISNRSNGKGSFCIANLVRSSKDCRKSKSN